MIFSALISHQVEQRKKLERRMQVTKTELGSLSRNADSIAQLLEARTKFIQTAVAKRFFDLRSGLPAAMTQV